MKFQQIALPANLGDVIKFITLPLFSALFLCSLFWVSCGDDSSKVVNPEEIECYIAFNSASNSFVKVINTLNREISTRMLHRHPIGAHIDERSCALIGVVAGIADEVEILECNSDGTCGGGRRKTVSFRLQRDETLTIIIDNDFFK
jgi:hypothetical protein